MLVYYQSHFGGAFVVGCGCVGREQSFRETRLARKVVELEWIVVVTVVLGVYQCTGHH